MRKQQKQIKFLLLFSLFIYLLFPVVTAAENNTEKGKLKIKKDRIIKEEHPDEQFGSTELDIIFPNLFTGEVNDIIKRKQDNDAKQMNELKDTILMEDIGEETGLSEIKSSLFTEDYVTSTTRRAPIEENKQSITSTVLFYASIGLMIIIIFSVIYALIRKFKTEG